MQNELSKKLREVRKVYNYSQRSFSEVLRVSQDTLESWEQGRQRPPEWSYRLLMKELDSMLDDKRGNA